MTTLHLKLTREPDVAILGCLRCDTALLPDGQLPHGGPVALHCPLCGFEQPAEVVEVGGADAFPYNPAQQEQDAAQSPIYLAESVGVDEDLVLVDVPALLDDPAFYALQDGVAPVITYGWVGGTGLMGGQDYRLFLVVRVSGQPEEDLFRVEFPAQVREDLSVITDDRTLVLVSRRKGVFCPEGGEAYLEAVRGAGGKPGDAVPLNFWIQLEENL